ncbi:MAG TPA: ATP-binding protein [Longimicrobiales bacterium]|nr:ATP-binding protein [Longimicrobiales bacterium]
MTTSSTTPTSPRVRGASAARLGFVRALAGLPRVRPFLRLTVFWKIFLANVALVIVGAGMGAFLAMGMHEASTGTLAVTALTLASVVILLGILINAILVRTALSPFQALEETARRVGQGETEARAEDSPLADTALSRVTAVFNDMLDALSANRTRQQELARRVLESEERERQRIAHELYSGTAQTLAGVLVRLRIAERHLTSGANGSIIEIREEVVSALEEIRGVARRLRPPELDELGVRVALEAHARSMTEGRRMDIHFHGEVPALSRESSLALFRIVQEAISNAVLHSGADTVDVRFTTEDAVVVVVVADDGCGFDLGAALAQTGQSLGLFGMHERAGYVQGELSLESGPGRGTRVRVALPFTPQREPQSVQNGTVDRLVDGMVEDAELAAASPAASRESSPPF